MRSQALPCFAGPTLAADLPVKAPPPPALAWSWAGFYLGTHGGYGWGRNDFYQVLTLLPPVAIGGVDPKGWVAGGQTGYNWQNGRWVAGVELDGSATGVRGENTPSARFSATQDVKYLGTLRARAGGIPFANADVLLYGTAGLAWERDNRADADLANNPAIRDQPRDHFGWVAGVGGEFRLGATSWIGRIEYLHYDFGMIEGAFQISGALNNFANTGGRHTIDVVRGGISYKFDQPSSPLTAYAAYKSGKAAPPPVAWSWAGFYLGAHGGFGWKRNDFAQVLGDNPPVPGLDSSGGLAGAQAGYNWQYGSWVTGFEVDGSRTWIHGDGASRDFGGVVAGFGDDVKYLGTVRTRVGVAIPANAGILLYGTAGLAWEQLDRARRILALRFRRGRAAEQHDRRRQRQLHRQTGPAHHRCGTRRRVLQIRFRPRVIVGLRSLRVGCGGTAAGLELGRVLSRRPRRLWLGTKRLRANHLDNAAADARRCRFQGLGGRRTGRLQLAIRSLGRRPGARWQRDADPRRRCACISGFRRRQFLHVRRQQRREISRDGAGARRRRPIRHCGRLAVRHGGGNVSSAPARSSTSGPRS